MKIKEEIKQLRQLDRKVLLKNLDGDYHKLSKVKIDTVLGKNKNVKEIGKINKRIARIWTILGETIEKEKH